MGIVAEWLLCVQEHLKVVVHSYFELVCCSVWVCSSAVEEYTVAGEEIKNKCPES